MKNIFIALAFLFLSPIVNAQDDTEIMDSDIIENVNTETSKVVWVGRKVTGQHTGTIQLESGQLEMDNSGYLIGGTIKIDMTTIQCTDLEGDDKAKLEGHLSSEDFFGVEKYPLAVMVITDVKSTGENSYDVIAELTIKDVTETVGFSTSIVDNEAIAQIIIDRTKYGIKYGSGSFFDGLGDKTINDEFELLINLSF